MFGQQRLLAGRLEESIYIAGACAVIASIAVAHATAQIDPRGPDGYRLYGDGGTSCGSLSNASIDSAARETRLQWIMGFLSAHDRVNRAGFKVTDRDAIEAWIANYCAMHPSDLLHEAAQILVIELGDRSQ